MSHGSVLSASTDSKNENGKATAIELTNLDSVHLASEKSSTAAPAAGDHRDFGNVLLLIVLYLLQGVPMGLASGSIPFLLKEKMGYAEIAIFSLAGYPYSLKLFWSPIVDAIFSRRIGRRKTWIMPIQVILGCIFLWLGANIEHLLDDARTNLTWLTVVFVSTVFLCATQDIAVDGWALTLLSQENLSYASTCQTIGLNTGFFMSFTILLALNSSEFSNKYLRSEPLPHGVLPLGGYITFWAFVYFAVTAWLLVFKKEDDVLDENAEDLNISSTYHTIFEVCKLPHMRRFIIVMLFAKIGFMANDAVTGLKLMEKGLGKEDLALTVLIDFPFQIFFGYYAAIWSSGPRPMRPWLYAFYMRLSFAVIGMLIVYFAPTKEQGGIGSGYFALIVSAMVMTSFSSTVQFVGISAFMSNIADPVIGGTYMTLLNTVSNFGGTWPKYFVLEAVDFFTVAHCELPPHQHPSSGGEFNEAFSCARDEQKRLCTSMGVERDGYYMTGILCVIIGAALFAMVISKQIRYIESLPRSAWLLRPDRRD
ncbi:hypothetical protein GQ42DRAFT_174896 [Ramicandelaber brevisporus]|nr:hypothetical protein GQ42DRAFT_174896 [Ramicandelaber brevisporus]